MAKAKAAQIDIVTTTTVPGVRLDLTKAEAQVLYDILARVGGASSGRRGLSDNVMSALLGTGEVRPYSSDDPALFAPRHSSLYFAEGQ